MDEKFSRVSSTPVRLREAMNAIGKKQVDLVRETGIDKGSISNYLSGRYEPKQEAIYKLALALDVSEMWLWGYDVPPERPTDDNKPEEKEKPTVKDDGLSPKRKAFIDKVMQMSDEELDRLDKILDLVDGTK